MTHHLFPTPPTHPLERLHVYDGLMMNADRWLVAQKYHRDRQNIHYQSLHQPGIVCGLGINVKPPNATPDRCRGRLLEIQPGIAIDMAGNLMIVDKPITYPIATEAPAVGLLTVYLSISYVEPENPSHQQPEPTVREWFRFDETTMPPTEEKVELCRVQLQPGTIALERSKDVFLPQINQLDLRYRRPAQAKPQAFVRVAQVEDRSTQGWNNHVQENFSYLLQALPALYPSMQGSVGVIKSIDLQTPTALQSIDLIYLTGWQILNLDPQDFKPLKDYLKIGGSILIEVPDIGIDLEGVKQAVVRELDTSLQPWQDFDQNSTLHSLRTQPFLFAALPVYQQPIRVWAKGGVILAAGELSAAWGLGDGISLSREAIRTAQEFGINLLLFAWRRKQLTQLSR